MIIPSKQVLLLAPTNSKQLLLFDPKTGCVLTTYTSQSQLLLTRSAYYEHGQEFIVPHLNNSYVNVWDTDAKEGRKFTVGDGDKITSVLETQGNVLYMGSSSGVLYVYQLPTGILVRKVQLYSNNSAIVKIVALNQYGFLLTCTKKQIKQWSLHTIFNSNSQNTKPLPNNTIQSVLQIIDIEIVRQILCVITEKNVIFYYVNNFHIFQFGRDLPALQSICCSCASNTAIFVGDAFGKIREIVIEAAEKELRYEERKGRLTLESRKGIQLDLKQPIVSMVYIEPLEYLISTTTKGQLKIHHKQSLKNSLQLSKSPLYILLSLPRPSRDKKIPQSHKIRSFHKQELSKIDQPVLFIENNGVSLHKLGEENVKNQIVLQRMLRILGDQSEQAMEEAEALKKEKKMLIEANLQYFNALQSDQLFKC